jgi:hypothetical protein
MAWGREEPVESGELERCFTSPAPGMTGAARIRADLIGPGAQAHSFYSPDTLTLLGTTSPCTESVTICCTEASESAGPTDGGSEHAPAGAGSSQASVDAAQGGARSPGSASERAAGCALISPPQPSGSSRRLALVLLGLLIVRVRPTRARANGQGRRRTPGEEANHAPC